MKMTTEEAFVKVLQMHGIEHAFGIIGSAFMPISDLFPQAGITFWDVAHETNGGLICDGYTRSTGKIAMAIAQNGPGITNFVTAIKTAYWNHTPMLLVTPQAANKTIGQGGFQEVEQMALFRDMVCYQEEVRDPSRVAEVLNSRNYQSKAPVGSGANQHPARLLDPGHRHQPAGDRRIRASGWWCASRRGSGEAAVGSEVPRHIGGCWCRSRQRDPRMRRAGRHGSTRRFAITISTTTAFLAVIALPSGRLATTARKPRWSSSLKLTWFWRSAPGSIRFRPCRAMASTTGRRRPRSFRSISMPTGSA